MNPFAWVGGMVRRFKEAGVAANRLRDENSGALRDLTILTERGECDPNVVAQSLDSVSVNMTMRLKGDTDHLKKKEKGGV